MTQCQADLAACLASTLPAARVPKTGQTGLITRIEGTHRYHVTDHGLRIALFFTRTYTRILRPGLAHVLPRAPTPTSALRRAFHALETAMDRWCAAAKLAA